MNEYQISVSINGQFLFRTEWQSSENYKSVNTLCNLLADKFPASEGYKLDIIYRKIEQFITQYKND